MEWEWNCFDHCKWNLPHHKINPKKNLLSYLTPFGLPFAARNFINPVTEWSKFMKWQVGFFFLLATFLLLVFKALTHSRSCEGHKCEKLSCLCENLGLLLLEKLLDEKRRCLLCFRVYVASLVAIYRWFIQTRMFARISRNLCMRYTRLPFI